jgi:ribosomal protein S18 acetylase RimI-like enzyme
MSEQSLSIRPFRPADVPILTAFVRQLHDAERELISVLVPGAALAEVNVRRMLDDVEGERGTILMGWLGERAVCFGCILIDDFRDPSFCQEVRRRAYISYLYVERDYRRRGFARELLGAMEREAARRGCARLVARCKAANRSARSCFQSQRFAPFEVIYSKDLAGRTSG